MHVLIATDGSLDAERCAGLACRLAGSDGQITVLTAVEIPRTLLSSLRAGFEEAELLILDGESVDVRPSEASTPTGWPGDNAFIDRYLNDRSEQATGSLIAALEACGVQPAVDVRESENPAATILDAIRELQPDVVCIGSHGAGRFEGLLGGTGTKIARLAPCPVLLIRDA